MSRRAVAVAASLALISPLLMTSAHAACTRLAFSVNDYGKEGPTRDAKNLLDKYIKTWTSERGIKKYTVGPKDVSCELFLDFIVFDEHTCKASALVCWSGPKPPDPTNASAPSGASEGAAGGAKRAPAKSATPKAAAPKAAGEVAPIETGSVTPAARIAPVPAKAPAARAPAKAVEAATEGPMPPAAPVREAPVAPPAQ